MWEIESDREMTGTKSQSEQKLLHCKTSSGISPLPTSLHWIFFQILVSSAEFLLPLIQRQQSNNTTRNVPGFFQFVSDLGQKPTASSWWHLLRWGVSVFRLLILAGPDRHTDDFCTHTPQGVAKNIYGKVQWARNGDKVRFRSVSFTMQSCGFLAALCEVYMWQTLWACWVHFNSRGPSWYPSPRYSTTASPFYCRPVSDIKIVPTQPPSQPPSQRPQGFLLSESVGLRGIWGSPPAYKLDRGSWCLIQLHRLQIW